MDWLRHLPGALVFLSRGAFTSIIGNLSLAGLSVALSVSLWLFVTARENPKEVQTFNSAIPIRFVNLPNDLAVANASESTTRISVEGTANDLKDLRAADFDATVDLGGYGKGSVQAAVDVISTIGAVSVVDVRPARIDVTLDARGSKQVPVTVRTSGSPQQGFAAVNPAAAPGTATVEGPESLVALVDHVSAEVGITGARVDVTEDRASLTPRDARDGEISRVRVSPETARVTVVIEQREFSRDIIVTPSISGQPAAGYNVTGVLVDPSVVTVTGPTEALQSIDAVRGITTEEISIADSRNDVVRTSVQLVLPKDVRVQGGGPVKVTVTVRPARGEASFSVVPQVRNVAAGLAVIEPQGVIVTLAGDVPILQTITVESITVIADAQGLAAGLRNVSLSITPPPGTSVVRSDPGELGIALVARP